MYSKNRYSMFHRPLLNAFDLNLISIGGGGSRRDASILVCSIFPWPPWMQIIINRILLWDKQSFRGYWDTFQEWGT